MNLNALQAIITAKFNSPPTALPYVRLPKTCILYTFTLKMATTVFAETLDNFQHSMRLTLESRSYIFFLSQHPVVD
jgi:hypothetical protein